MRNAAFLFGMFSECTNLRHLDVASWDMPNLDSFGAIFENCENLTFIDLSGWDTSSVNLQQQQGAMGDPYQRAFFGSGIKVIRLGNKNSRAIIAAMRERFPKSHLMAQSDKQWYTAFLIPSGKADTYSASGAFPDVIQAVTIESKSLLAPTDVLHKTAALDKSDRIFNQVPKAHVRAYSISSSTANMSCLTIYQKANGKIRKIASAGRDGDFGMVPYDQFEVGEKVFLSVTDAQGRIIETHPLLLTVEDSGTRDIPTSFEIGDGVKLTLSNWPFNGQTIEMPVCSFPVTSKISADGKVQMGINIPLMSSDDPEWDSKIRDAGYLKDLVSDGKNKNILSRHKESRKKARASKLEPTIAGFVEGDLATGRFKGELAIEVSWRTAQENQVSVLGVPVVIEVSGGIDGSGTFASDNIVIADKKLKIREGSFKVDLSGTVGLYGGVGFAYVASAGIWGSITAGGSANLLPKWQLNELYLQGKCGLKALILGKSFTLTLSPEDKLKWYLYRRNNTFLPLGAQMSSPLSDSTAGMDPEFVQLPLSRSYLPRLTSWDADAQETPESAHRLQGNAYPDAQIQMVETEGGMLATFLADDEERNDANRATLMWTRYDESTHAWTSPQPVWQDGTMDCYPSLCQDGSGGAYIVWSDSRQAVGDQDSLTDIARHADVALAHYDATSQTVTDCQFVNETPDFYEAGIRVASIDGKPTVAWYQNMPQNIAGDTGEHGIILATQDDGGWSCREIATATGLVTGIDVGSLSETGIAWAADADGLIETQSDTHVMLWEDTNGTRTIGAEGSWNPCFAKAEHGTVLAWGQNDSMIYMDDRHIVKHAFDGLPYTNWRVIGDLADNAIVTYLRYADNRGNVVGRICSEGTWLDEDALVTDQGKNVLSYATTFPDGTPCTMWISANETADTISEAEIWFSSGGTQSTARLDSARYDNNAILASVTNCGATPITDAKVSVSENGQTVAEGTAETTLSAGENTEITIPMQLPNDGQTHEYEVAVTPGSLEGTPISIRIGEPKLRLSSEHTLEDGTETILIKVSNAGIAPTSTGTLSVYDMTGEERLLDETSLPALAGGESNIIRYLPDNGNFLADDGIGMVEIRAEADDGSGHVLKATDFVKALTDYDETFDAQAPGEHAATFSDVDTSTSHWDEVTWLAACDVSTGWTNNDGTRTFRPYDSVARADMAAFLFRLARRWGIVEDDWQASAEQQVIFRDVNASTPHAREIWWLADVGISGGWETGSGHREFRPYATVARQDMAAFLFRLARASGRGGIGDSWTADTESRQKFLDVDGAASDNHHDEIWWLAEQGISTGWELNGGRHEFRGLQNVARCDMAAFLSRMNKLD